MNAVIVETTIVRYSKLEELRDDIGSLAVLIKLYPEAVTLYLA